MVMEAVYGKQEYARSGQPDWKKVAVKPHYIEGGKQGFNECGYYTLQYAKTFDGDGFVEHIADQDPRSMDWKAEYLYTIVFHHDNLITVDNLPSEDRCLSPGGEMSEDEEDELLRLIAQRGE